MLFFSSISFPSLLHRQQGRRTFGQAQVSTQHGGCSWWFLHVSKYDNMPLPLSSSCNWRLGQREMARRAHGLDRSHLHQADIIQAYPQPHMGLQRTVSAAVPKKPHAVIGFSKDGMETGGPGSSVREIWPMGVMARCCPISLMEFTWKTFGVCFKDYTVRILAGGLAACYNLVIPVLTWVSDGPHHPGTVSLLTMRSRSGIQAGHYMYEHLQIELQLPVSCASNSNGN